MYMKTAGIFAIAVLGILAVSAGVQAQTSDTMPAGATSASQQLGALPPMPPMPPDEAVTVIGAELGPGHRLVKGSPLSAQTNTEVVRVLADGTHIDQKSNGSISRDSQGRTRLEVAHPPLAAGMGTVGGIPAYHIVFIMDPVAQTHYILEPDRKIARQMGMPPAGDMKRMEAFHGRGMMQGGKNTTTESLGTQTINGVSATGTRITQTIPVGEIGNDQPIQVVVERWYSPALQMNIMTKRNDPRIGTITYQLADISQEEPPASLFQVPSDYTIEQGPPMNMMHMHHPQP
jgi:hypothetical protein